MDASLPHPHSPLWLAVAFPELGLALHTRALPRGASPRPLALVSEGRVLVCNAEAAAAGVAHGQRTANAVALCPPLRFLDHLPEEEARLLRQLAEACIAVTPTVVLSSPHSLLLEVGGCLQLFRGQLGVLKVLQRALKPFGVRAVLAQAPTPKAALALVNSEQAAASLLLEARCRAEHPQGFPPGGHQPAALPASPPAAETAARVPPYAIGQGSALHAYLPLLQQVPVEALQWTPEQLKKLQRLHLHTLGELLALPRASLSKRLGVAATRYLAQLEGSLPDPQAPITAAEEFEATLFFLDGIVHVEGLRFPMKRLLDDFCRFLRQRQLSCARFTWRFAHQDKSRQQLAIASARGEPQAARFMQLTELKLEHFRISAPVEAVTLQAREFQPQSDTRLALLPEPGQEDEKAMELLDRLRARLGVDACQQLRQVSTLWPEREQELGQKEINQRGEKLKATASHSNPLSRGTKSGMWVDGQPSPLFSAEQPLRPFWIWPEAKAVRVIDGQLWWQGAFTLLSRPERIVLPWWEDGDTRDYYLARHDNGAHYWLYFSQRQQAWFCQGVFG